MPEGPEVQIEADEIAKVLVGQRLRTVFFYHEQPAAFTGKFTGKKVLSVQPFGKAMVINIEGGWSIYSHNQLYGKWLVLAGDEAPDSTRSLRMALRTRKGSACLMSASEIVVMPTHKVLKHPYIQKLGPNCLDPKLTDAMVMNLLKKNSNRKLATVLLDQSFISGLGNYLRSEILFDAGLLAHHKPEDLTDRQLGKLARSILRIPQRSYKTHGRTRPGPVRKDNARTFEATRFWVYGRAGLACYKCGTKIERSDQSSRGIYYCPDCQK